MSKIIGVHVPSQISNLIINGNFDIWQRGTANTGTNVYLADRFIGINSASSNSVFQQQDASVPSTLQTNVKPSYALKLNSTGAGSTVAGTIVGIEHRLEGFSYAQIHAKTFTLSFWCKSNLPGTYSVSFRSSGGVQSYVQRFTINSANTYEKKIITVAPSSDNADWNFTNALGMHINWNLSIGSTYQGATEGAWSNGNFLSVPGQTDWNASSTNNFYLSQVMLNEGPLVAPFERAGLDLAGELAKCQRYFERNADGVANGVYPQNIADFTQRFSGSSTQNSVALSIKYSVTKRTTGPATHIYWENTNGTPVDTTALNYAGADGWAISVTITAGGFADLHDWYADAEL